MNNAAQWRRQEMPMARYKPVDPHLSELLPFRLSEQILPGTFEHALNWQVDYEIDPSVFDARYRNDETGASRLSSRCAADSTITTYAASHSEPDAR